MSWCMSAHQTALMISLRPDKTKTMLGQGALFNVWVIDYLKLLSFAFRLR